jgi:hypothetical protein
MALTDRVRIVSIPEGCGGTLTAATIEGLTPTRLAAYSKIEHNKARVIAEAKEAREIGVIGKPLTDLLMSRISEIGKGALVKSSHPNHQSMILPYSYRTRRSRIGNPQFRITAGSANANAGTTVNGIVYPTSAWNLTVDVGVGYVSQITDIHRYFLPGTFVYVETVTVSSGVRRVIPLKVVTASTTSSITTLTVAANRTAAWWAASTTPEKTFYRPTFGVVVPGNNDVADYESWCHNEPTELSKSLLVDFHQTTRYSQCYNDEYAKTLAALVDGNVNDVAKSFDFLSLAEQNAQQRKRFEDKWFNDVFFGNIIDEKQLDPNNYNLLPPVVDVEDGTVYGYKSRAKGVRTLLDDDGQVIDLLGGPIDVDLLLEKTYDLYRTRKADGSSIEVIDWMTDRLTASKLRIVFRKIQKDTYGTTDQYQYSAGQVLEGTKVRFRYERYQLPGLPCDIAIFTDEWFDDRVASFPGVGDTAGTANLRNSGRCLWAIDWSDLNLAIVGTNSAKREYAGKVTADANALYTCVIALNTKHVDLRSTTWTMQIGDAKRSVMIENFNLDEVPTYTLDSAAPGYTSS